MHARVFLLLLLGTLISPAHACLNDRDSRLGYALGQFPQVQEVLTGRFERNPALFYEQRVARVEKELAAKPNEFALYDDIAVALDRLHQDDSAIAWMQKKRVVLERIAPRESLMKPEWKEHWYSYHANLGTFYAHRWISKHNEHDLADLKQARDHIARAVEIKPEAHFGREPVQLLVIEWLLDGRKESLADFLESEFPERLRAQQEELRQQVPVGKRTPEIEAWLQLAPNKAAIEGLTGLVVLGAAWESVDLFDAIAHFLKKERNVAILAQFRVDELVKAGRKSFFSAFAASTPDDESWVKSRYDELRQEADSWQQNRTEYLLVRLKAGRHPDTDPGFWNDWHPRPLPYQHRPWYVTLFGDDFLNAAFRFIVFPALVLLAIRGIGRQIKQRWRT